MRCRRKSEPIDFVRLDNTTESILEAVGFVFDICKYLPYLDLRDAVVEKVRNNGGLDIPTASGVGFVRFGEHILRNQDNKLDACSPARFNDMFEVIKE